MMSRARRHMVETLLKLKLSWVGPEYAMRVGAGANAEGCGAAGKVSIMQAAK